MSLPGTITAIATPPGYGGVGVVRISGPGTRVIAEALLGAVPSPRLASYRRFRDVDGDAIDEGLALFFPAPRSFTGEDVLELHAHGAPVVLDRLLQRVVRLGARLAAPGEFSERAFLNGKIDLAQAEAIADLITASSEAAARSALHSLQGLFSREVSAIVERLVALRTYVEAAIDFPEEEIDFLADARIADELDAIAAMLQQLLSGARQGVLRQAGVRIVLIGAPNAGKSSLLNALTREDTAIVSPIPGTTRDIVRAQIVLDGMPLNILDTAGLRLDGDALEQAGMERARSAMQSADHALLVLDDSAPRPEALETLLGQLPAAVAHTLIFNKIDLTGRSPGYLRSAHGEAIALSAKTGVGLHALGAHLKKAVGYAPAGEGAFTARRRHVDALERAQRQLDHARAHAQSHAGELLADELAAAQRSLGEITGIVTSDDLLARIFASFCIGK